MEKGHSSESSTQNQPSREARKETIGNSYSTCREDIAEVAIADIQPCPLIPDYKPPTLSNHPIVVRTPEAYFCIDGWHYIEQAQAEGQSRIRCHVYHITEHSDIELAIRKVAIRVMPQGGKCWYAELVRNTSHLYQNLKSKSDDLVLSTHGGDRRSVAFTDSKEKNIVSELAIRLGKSPTTISKYLQHGKGLNDSAMEELVNVGAPKLFFEAIQTQKDIGMAALRAEKKDESAIVAEISSLVSTWWKESQQPVPQKTTTSENPQPVQPARTTGPTRPTPRDSRDNAPTQRSPQNNSGGNQDPPVSDSTSTDTASPSAELKRIGETLIEIAESQEGPTPQQIECIRMVIVDLSALLQRLAQSTIQEGNNVGGTD